MLKKSKLTQSVLDKIQSLTNKSVFSIYKEYVLFIENSKLHLKEIQSYFVANCIPVCQNKWDTHFLQLKSRLAKILIFRSVEYLKIQRR